MNVSELEELQAWFSAQCDGDWEHQQGIRIESLDNPGWRLSIDLVDTELEERSFETVEENYDDESNWMRCWLSKSKFEVACGPARLSDALRVFLDWATP